jgi:hypothetical protein
MLPATLVVDPAKTGFDGSIAITGEVAQRSSVIWLHGRQLAVQRASAAGSAARRRRRAHARHGERDTGRWAAPRSDVLDLLTLYRLAVTAARTG